MSRWLSKSFRIVMNNNSTKILFCVSVIVFSFLIGIFSPSLLYGKPLEVDIFIPREDPFWKKAVLLTEEAASDLGMKLRVYNANDNPDKMIAQVRKTAQRGYTADIILSVEAIKNVSLGKEASEYDRDRVLLLIGIAIIVFLLLILLIGFLTRFSKGKHLVFSFGSHHFRMYAVIGLSLLITVVSVLGWLAVQRNKEKILAEVQANLVNVLTTTSERLHIWVNQRNFFMQQFGRNPELVAITERLLKVEPWRDTLSASSALANARDFFETNKDVFDDIGYFIINQDYISIASMRDINIGSVNKIAIHKPE